MISYSDHWLKEAYDRVSVVSVSARPIHSLEEQLSKLLIMVVLLCCARTRVVESQEVLRYYDTTFSHDHEMKNTSFELSF